MNGKDAAQGLADAFAALDMARNQAKGELIKAANQALGEDLFKYVSYSRHSQGIDIVLTARIPCDSPSCFFDDEDSGESVT